MSIMTEKTTISDYYHYNPYKRKDRQKKWCGYFQFSVDFYIRLRMFDLLVGRRRNKKLYWGHIYAYTEKERDDLAKKYKAILEERIAKMINDYDKNEIYRTASIKKLNGDVIYNEEYFCVVDYSSEEDQDYTSETVKFINVRKKRRRRQQNKNDNHNRNYQDNHSESRSAEDDNVDDKEEKEEYAEEENNEDQNEDPVNEMDDSGMDDGGMDVNNKEENDDPEQQYIGSPLHIENTEYWQQNSREGKGSGRRRCGNGSNEDVQMD